MEAPRGVELTGTNGRGTIHHASHATRPHPRTTGSTWSRNAEHETSRPSSGSQSVTRNHPPPAGGKNNRRFAAAMAQVRRPVPFRTRKLRPGTAMVLHPRGCGRVARRRITLTERGSPRDPRSVHIRQTSVLRMDTTGTTWISTQVLPDTLVGGVELNPVVCRVAGLNLRLRFIERILLRR